MRPRVHLPIHRGEYHLIGKSHISNRCRLEQANVTEGSSPNQCLARQKENMNWDWKTQQRLHCIFLEAKKKKFQLFPIMILKLLANFWGWIYLLIAYEKISYSDQISRSVVSNSLRPHESQHTRPPCPSPTPGVHLDSRPSSQ